MAGWDPSGTRVLCSSRAADGTVCTEVLALLRRQWLGSRTVGRMLYWLRFVHNAWVERGGVWRETTETRARRQQGWTPRSRTRPYRVDAQTGQAHYGGDSAIPVLPAVLRCPACKSRRRLDPELLDVLGGLEAQTAGASCGHCGHKGLMYHSYINCGLSTASTTPTPPWWLPGSCCLPTVHQHTHEIAVMARQAPDDNAMILAVVDDRGQWQGAAVVAPEMVRSAQEREGSEGFYVPASCRTAEQVRQFIDESLLDWEGAGDD